MGTINNFLLLLQDLELAGDIPVTDPIDPHKLELVLKEELQLFQNLYLFAFTIPSSGNQTNNTFFIETLLCEIFRVSDLLDLIADEFLLINFKHFLNGDLPQKHFNLDEVADFSVLEFFHAAASIWVIHCENGVLLDREPLDKSIVRKINLAYVL